jgi:hypothetical protein
VGVEDLRATAHAQYRQLCLLCHLEHFKLETITIRIDLHIKGQIALVDLGADIVAPTYDEAVEGGARS